MLKLVRSFIYIAKASPRSPFFVLLLVMASTFWQLASLILVPVPIQRKSCTSLRCQDANMDMSTKMITKEAF